MNQNEVKIKRYSVVAVVALCAVLSSMLVMRHAAKRVTDELLHIPAPTATQVTEAENDVADVPDPRVTLPEEPTGLTLPTEENTEAPTTEPAPIAATTARPTTTAPVTEPAAVTVKNNHFILPLEGTQVTKDFSPEVLVFSKTMRDWRTHGGVDLAANAGSEVRSVGNGKVSKVISDPQRGYTIEVDYGTFIGRYCGISQENAVGIDTELHTGDVIGTLGDMPLESADTPHLHFEAIQNGVPVDPMKLLDSSTAEE